MNEIPREQALKLISQSSLYGNLGLFVGAGMSMAILNKETPIALSWKELIERCAKEFDIGWDTLNKEGLSYPEIASEIAKSIAQNKSIEYNEAIKKLKEAISKLTSWYPTKKEREEFGEVIEGLHPSWIITTNYDLIIECLLTGKCLSLGPDDQLISPKDLIPIYHLHGVRTNPTSIIIAQEDYVSLFRPNQYRQQKLSLSMKESTTLIIGYGLGDTNVLTAIDWTQNVYSNQRINYPHEIIQLLYTQSPRQEAYKDRNNILIIEFDDLKNILSEISNLIQSERLAEGAKNKELKTLNALLSDPSEKDINQFIDNKDHRESIVQQISQNDKLISGFLELFSKSIDETRRRAKVDCEFEAYNQCLILLLDILERIDLPKIPPALLESIAYNLDWVSYYIGDSLGKSYSANRTWKERKMKIPDATVTELHNIAKARNHFWLSNLWNK
jgi:hypothetical protein